MHWSIPFDVIKTIENWLLFCLSLFFSRWFVAWDYIWFTSLVFNKWYVAPIIFMIQNGALRVSACNNHFELGLKNLWQKLILPKVTLWFEFQKTLSWRLAWNKKRVQTLPKKPWIIYMYMKKLKKRELVPLTFTLGSSTDQPDIIALQSS